MKRIQAALLSIIFVCFISITFILSFVFNWDAMLASLVENKDKILDFNVSSEYFKSTISTVGTAFDGGIFLRNYYVDLYGGIQKVCGKKIIWDSDPSKTIMIGSDGKLYSVGNVTLNFSKSEVNKEQIDKYGQAIKELGYYTKKNGSSLVFFLEPARYDSDKVVLPVDFNDNSKENVNYMFSILKDDDNLTVLNSQHLYEEQGKNFNDMFFKTDHHWTISTAFWAYSEICKILNSDYDYNIDPFFYDISSYNVETVPNKYLGSYGVRVGRLFAGYDDFDLIYPKFETDYVKRICREQNKCIAVGGEIKSTGSYTETIIPLLADIKNGKSTITFGSYISSDRSEVIISNAKSATNKKILVIKDSFALPVTAFLSTCFTETRMIDMRYMHDMTVYDYIDNYKPDLVLILYNPGAYNDVFFNFG